jgi:hypothetical protein
MTPVVTASSTKRARSRFWGTSASWNFVERRAEVGFHGVDADDELVGDLLVGCRDGVLRRILERTAQGEEDAPLCR